MIRLTIPAVLAAAVLAGCSGLQTSGTGARYAASPSVLQAGDLVVAVDRGARHAVLRIRPGRALEGTGRVQTTSLLTLEVPIASVAASADGRWLAVGHGDADAGVSLFELSATELPVWTSPRGCREPTFHPASDRLVLACAAGGTQPEHLLQVRLDTFEQLAFVGERHRRHPAFGVDGDLYWTEPSAGRTRIVRRSRDRMPYRTHELVRPVRALWPQEDGSLLAELAVPGTRREFVRLLASGAVRDTAAPQLLLRPLARGIPLLASTDGDWFMPLCERGPCMLVQVGDTGTAVPIALAGTPTAVGRVPRLARPMPHPEDLATAPAEVLSRHPANEVAVLGIELGTPLETAFSTLDRAGRHPYWIEDRSGRDRPRGIGLGWSPEGHCIEYLADDRGIIHTVDLWTCAGHYLSPTLRPLLDSAVLSGDDGLDLARRFLGPEVAMTVGGGDEAAVGSVPILRTDVLYTAPARGYHFEAHSEILQSGRTRILGGTVWLRLQLPGRRTAAVRP